MELKAWCKGTIERKCFFICVEGDAVLSLTKLFKTTALLLNDQVKSCPQVQLPILFSPWHFFCIIIVVHILHLSTSWKTLPALQSATHPLAFPNHALHLSCPTPICLPCSTLSPSVPFGWLHSHMSSDGQLLKLASPTLHIKALLEALSRGETAPAEPLH